MAVKYPGGQIAVAPITDDHHDHCVAHLGIQAQGSGYRAAGGDATEDAFFPGQSAHGVLGFLLAHVHHPVHPLLLEDARQVFLRPAADTRNRRPLGGLQADDLHLGILFLEIARHAHDGAGGAHGADEMRHPAMGIPPDFRAGTGVMGFGVVHVAELIQHLAPAFAVHLQRQIPGPFHALFLAHQNQFGTVGGHRPLALVTGVLRHDQDHPVAHDRRGHGQGDAGIAGGGLDQGITGLDVAALLGQTDHRQRRAILHRARRVVAFELEQNGVAGIAGHALQAHQRGIADAIGNGWKLASHRTSFGNQPGGCPGCAFRSMITATGKGMHILNKSAMKRQPNLGVKARLLLMTLLPTALMALVIGGYFSWQQLRDTEQQLLQRGLMTVEYLQRPAASALLTSNHAPLGATLYAALNYTDVRAMTVYDVAMNALEHRGPKMQPAGPPVTGVELAAGTGLQIHRGEHSTRFMLPLLASVDLAHRQDYPHIEPDSLLGWLEVELSHGNTLIRQYQGLLATLVTIILGLALTAAVVSIMGRRITQPILRLNAAIGQISQGHFDIRLEEQSSRELDDLARGINDMAQTMQSAQGELQQNIDQATEDLRQTLETIEIQNIELDLARKTAQEASRIKSEFLANMSHELRTPLNSILGFSSLLQRSELSGRQQEYLTTIGKSADSLLAIINEILDFSKIEAGKLVLENLAFNLRDLIDETLTMLAPSAHDKGLELVSIIYRDTPLGLSGDPMRLKQILANLISNAIKFTHEGSVSVRVMAEQQDADQVLLRISVNDTGVGLSPTQQKALFKAFSQADNSISRQTGGTGLGLVISKRLVEQMQGEIGLRSQPGEGSEFWLTLRLGRSAHGEDDLPERPLLGLRAALVEPQLLSRQMLLHSLENIGLSVRMFDDTRELHEALTSPTHRDNSLQLALISTRHSATPPGETLELARQWSELNICKTIMLTDTTEHYPLLDRLPRSMCQTLSKPVNTRKLYRAALQLLSDQPARLPIPRQLAQTPRVLCVDDQPANLRLLEVFLADIGVTALLAHSGEEALDILTEQQVDLIFMDVQMPGMDGRQTTGELRLREEIAGFDPVPIIALTAHALDSERRQLLQCGMNDYLTKPITAEQLRQTLNKWTGMLMQAGERAPVLALPLKPAAVERPPTPSAAQSPSSPQKKTPNPASPPTPAVLDADEGLQLAAGKADLARDMLQMLLDGLPEDARRIRAAREAGDQSQLREIVHKLHGASRYCGVPQLRACCLEAENRLKKGEDSQPAIEALLQAIERLREACAEISR